MTSEEDIEGSNNTMRLGSLVFFKDGLSKEEIEKALRSISHIFDGNEIPYVREWRNDHGCPVWYIP